MAGIVELVPVLAMIAGLQSGALEGRLIIHRPDLPHPVALWLPGATHANRLKLPFFGESTLIIRGGVGEAPPNLDDYFGERPPGSPDTHPTSPMSPRRNRKE